MDASLYFVDWLKILSITLVLTQTPQHAFLFLCYNGIKKKKKKSNHCVLLLFSDIANQFDALLVVVEN